MFYGFFQKPFSKEISKTIYFDFTFGLCGRESTVRAYNNFNVFPIFFTELNGVQKNILL